MIETYTNPSSIMVSSVKTVDEERVVEQVPLTRTVDGVRIRTINTKTEGIGIIKIIETADIEEGLNLMKTYGYTNDDVIEIKSILTDAGISEVYIKDYYQTNDYMGFARCFIYDATDNMQLNLTFENNTLIYIQLTGIIDNSDVVSSRTDKLDLGVGLQGANTVELYDKGSFLVYLDWDLMTLEKIYT